MTLINALLSGKWIDPDTQQPVGVPVRSVKVEEGLKNSVRPLMESLDLGGSYLVVSDVNTHAILGRVIEDAVQGKSVVLPDGVKPDAQAVEMVRKEAAGCDVVVAVGSGTINDICKYASFLDNKPYMVFGTAPSMNGYSSANAAITVDGHKKSLAAHLPQGIFLDLDILCQAPKRLICSGLGDSLCRSTAQSDWLLSHLLLGTPYKEAPFVLLRENEAALFAGSALLLKGGRDAMRLLAETLLLSGFGMYLCGGSYPASQGEHLIAHTMEMKHGKSLPQTYHGEQIGVTTLTMAHLQHKVLSANTPPTVRPVSAEDVRRAVTGYFTSSVAWQCEQAYREKIFSGPEILRMNANLQECWYDIRAKLQQVAVDPRLLESVLRAAEAPVNVSDLGWEDDAYQRAVSHAKYVRERFTFLDFVG